MTVTVIIVNFNGQALVGQCLDALRRQTFADFSVIVVDNASKDGSVDYIRRHYPEVRLIRLQENLGFSRANNIAMAGVQSEFIALLNNDAVAHPRWLEHLVGALRANEAAGFTASKMVYQSAPGTIDRAGDGYTWAGAGLLRGRGDASGRWDREEWIFGACAGAALYRTRMLMDVGFFDDRFFLLYEDVDLSFRAQLKGYRCLYVPQAVVYHATTQTIGYDSPSAVYYGHRNLEWTYFKNMPGCLLCLTILPHLAYTLIAFAYFLFNGRAGVYLKSKKDAIAGMRRIYRQRKTIQRTRNVPVKYLLGIFDRELFLPRLTRRFKATADKQ